MLTLDGLIFILLVSVVKRAYLHEVGSFLSESTKLREVKDEKWQYYHECMDYQVGQKVFVKTAHQTGVSHTDAVVNGSVKEREKEEKGCEKETLLYLRLGEFSLV